MPVESDLLVWMDLEMSGLAIERERILEIAVIVTDGQLEILAEGPEIVVHQPDSLLDAMDDWNKQHHGASGLVDRVRASTISEAEAERQVLEFVAAHVPARAAPLAGNSVHQDRLFLAKYMPQVEKYLHYRNVDVSTLKELVRRWHPQAYAGRPTKRGSHRALGDIRESIDELRYYRRAVFVPST
ncbi:oligoribonuclease [Sandaracinus amylolyticus]|uniref:Oligoribonuclease n=1 Tax=Sandaracinus amylolyticus TaxID=927083 RepID=A0A0F6W585_9BACT|nr:oligoribonuclease [Sandaracinus amylolyticus]AKF07608.1 3'-to-5' oligoribonuclease (orn) [Sandaracinus amylolyticus]